MWVERDDAGAIKGVYAVRQLGYAEEELADDDAALGAFYEKLTPVPQLSFQARDLIDQLTEDDLLAIEAAVQVSPALRLLWLRLRTREGKPVVASGEAFARGWAGITAALGEERAGEIATSLGFGR